MPGCYLSICVCSCIMYLYIYAFACISVFVYIISIFIFEYILYPILSPQVPRSSFLPTQPDRSSWGSGWISFRCSWKVHNVKVITSSLAILGTFAPKVKVKTGNLSNALEKPTLNHGNLLAVRMLSLYSERIYIIQFGSILESNVT